MEEEEKKEGRKGRARGRRKEGRKREWRGAKEEKEEENEVPRKKAGGEEKGRKEKEKRPPSGSGKGKEKRKRERGEARARRIREVVPKVFQRDKFLECTCFSSFGGRG